jgi:hypothetical protein
MNRPHPRRSKAIARPMSCGCCRQPFPRTGKPSPQHHWRYRSARPFAGGAGSIYRSCVLARQTDGNQRSRRLAYHLSGTRGRPYGCAGSGLRWRSPATSRQSRPSPTTAVTLGCRSRPTRYRPLPTGGAASRAGRPPASIANGLAQLSKREESCNYDWQKLIACQPDQTVHQHSQGPTDREGMLDLHPATCAARPDSHGVS